VQGEKMSSNEDDLSLLLKKARKGDMESFNELFERTKERVFGAIVAMVKRDAIAEEILQEGYIALWENGAKIEKPLNWLFKFCVNKGIDYLRKSENLKSASLDEEEDSFPSSFLEPDIVLENAEEATLVRSIIETLPPKERVVFIMSDYSGMDSFEIASILNTSPSTVRNQLSGARKKFAKLYKEAKK
jgi:RNA polymerase sigma-70 factor (ECF subfamily)